MPPRVFSSRFIAWFLVLSSAALAPSVLGQDKDDRSHSVPTPDAQVEALKAAAVAGVESRRVMTQQMVDMIFSFSELGFQEFETQRYVTDILEREGFSVARGIADIPSAWVAKWGAGRPVIALGADVDGVPATNQKPGVLMRDELVPGTPGHGEGHNAGQALIVTAALAVKEVMEREGLPGTIVLWPGIAEEQLGAKAYFVRSGVFEGIDAVLYTHVSDNLSTGWGAGRGNGLVSVEYMFRGESSHAAGSPWSGRSALDAVELMNIGWNFRREHLRLAQRSHYVITEGGDQPNVVPPHASVWYFFREASFERIKQMWDFGNTMADAAAMMTGTTVTSRVLGSAYPQHANRPLAEATFANIQKVGMPMWTEADQQFARAFQLARGAEVNGLRTEVPVTLSGREMIPENEQLGGGSDDIGDIMWTVPTVTLRFPSNIPGATGHNWTSAVAMATPVAHKGATQGAKVHAMTLLDLMTRPELLEAAQQYFTNVQGKQRTYEPLIRPQDRPAVWLNEDIMDTFKPELEQHYYDPTRYRSYLEQLNITYPPPMSPPPDGQP